MKTITTSLLLTFTFEQEFEEEEVLVKFVYTPRTPGRNYLSNGDPGYPEEPATVDIFSVKARGEELITTMSAEAYDALTEQVLEDFSPEEC